MRPSTAHKTLKKHPISTYRSSQEDSKNSQTCLFVPDHLKLSGCLNKYFEKHPNNVMVSERPILRSRFTTRKNSPSNSAERAISKSPLDNFAERPLKGLVIGKSIGNLTNRQHLKPRKKSPENLKVKLQPLENSSKLFIICPQIKYESSTTLNIKLNSQKSEFPKILNSVKLKKPQASPLKCFKKKLYPHKRKSALSTLKIIIPKINEN